MNTTIKQQIAVVKSTIINDIHNIQTAQRNAVQAIHELFRLVANPASRDWSAFNAPAAQLLARKETARQFESYVQWIQDHVKGVQWDKEKGAFKRVSKELFFDLSALKRNPLLFKQPKAKQDFTLESFDKQLKQLLLKAEKAGFKNEAKKHLKLVA